MVLNELSYNHRLHLTAEAEALLKNILKMYLFGFCGQFRKLLLSSEPKRYSTKNMKISIKSFKELCDLFGHIISDELPDLIKNRIADYPEIQSVIMENRGHLSMETNYKIASISDIDIQKLENFINKGKAISNLVHGRQIKIIKRL